MSKRSTQSGPNAHAVLFAEKRSKREQDLHDRIEEAQAQERELARRCAEKGIPHEPMPQWEIVRMIKYEIACEEAQAHLYADDDPNWL